MNKFKPGALCILVSVNWEAKASNIGGVFELVKPVPGQPEPRWLVKSLTTYLSGGDTTLRKKRAGTLSKAWQKNLRVLDDPDAPAGIVREADKPLTAKETT